MGHLKILLTNAAPAVMLCISQNSPAQLKWICVDSLYQPLPASVHVYMTNDSMFDGKPNIAYYVVADLKDNHLSFDADTTYKRRLTPAQFYEKNKQPLVVVNSTFFSFETNQSLNVVVMDGRLAGYNIHSLPGRGKDTFTYRHPFRSAIGISKNSTADVAWLFTDSALQYPYARQAALAATRDSDRIINLEDARRIVAKTPTPKTKTKINFNTWQMQTAVGGGPVLLQNGQIKISNEEEMMFAGRAINDKHPRTAMGYTKDGKLIILVVHGRFPNIAEGATLTQEAQILKDLGCWEGLNLDGGGSSCMLVNGKTTITPSGNRIQRPVPAVFLIKNK